MESYLLDWANLLLRWVHVITAIAWIGSSFYFVFLDSSLTPPVDEALKRQGVSGELWAVHGGGFYHQRHVQPPRDTRRAGNGVAPDGARIGQHHQRQHRRRLLRQ